MSRDACLLRVQRDLVLILNQSAREPLVIRPPHGEDRRVGPGAATTSLPWGTFDVVFPGPDDEPVGVRVDARGLRPPPGATGEPPARGPGDRAPAGRPAPDPAGRRAALLTRTQRLALVALCEPMLTRNGSDARPRTTREIAGRLGWAPDYARNVVKDVRHRLAADGVPGLVPPPGAAGGGTELRLALARWAVECGAVTPADLTTLPPPPSPTSPPPAPTSPPPPAPASSPPRSPTSSPPASRSPSPSSPLSPSRRSP